jgi:hypothetical protein
METAGAAVAAAASLRVTGAGPAAAPAPLPATWAGPDEHAAAVRAMVSPARQAVTVCSRLWR